MLIADSRGVSRISYYITSVNLSSADERTDSNRQTRYIPAPLDFKKTGSCPENWKQR